MTDKEITKAMQHHIKRLCYECPLRDSDSSCSSQLCENALDLINRLKAELDESREKNAGLALALLHEVVNKDEQLRNEITKVAKSEARKEFAERLKGGFCSMCEYDGGDIKDAIDNLLKEMECDNA